MTWPHRTPRSLIKTDLQLEFATSSLAAAAAGVSAVSHLGHDGCLLMLSSGGPGHGERQVFE